MRKLLALCLILILGFALASCKSSPDQDETPNLVPSTSIIDDLSNQIKTVFED